METPAGTIYRFGPYEVDTATGELLRHGNPVNLQEQPFRLLVILLESSGEVVTRSEIQSRIWEGNTFVDFDSSLRVAVGKLRTALGDDAANPRYIETIPRRGYRFLGPATQSTTQPANSGQATVTAETSTPETPALSRGSRRWAIVTAGLLLAAIIAAMLLSIFRSKTRITEKDTVVLADFMNTTGDPVFNETLRQGTTIELEQSPFLTLVSEARIQHALALMGYSADARVTPEIARELCERTGSAAVLDGSIANLGSQYVLGLRARSCATGDVLAQDQTVAVRKEEVLSALSGIASDFRVHLGESLKTVQQHSAPLAEATTPSLEALKAYTTGVKIASTSGGADALPFFKRAIEIDPKFAMAYSVLGRVYGDLGESELSAQTSTKAYKLRDRASDEERYWIAASYEKQVTGDLEKAGQTCDLWKQAYPRALGSRGFLSGNISLVRGNFEKSIEEAKIALEIDPDFAIGYSNLAISYLALARIEEADNTLRQASARKVEIPDFILQRYMIAFLRGDTAAMEREVAAAKGKPGAEEWMANSEGFVLAYAGQLQEARKKSSQAVNFAREADQTEAEALYETDSALREALFGNVAAARQQALAALQRSHSREVEYGAAFALGIMGESSRLQSLADDLSSRFPQDTKVRFAYVPTLNALLALNHNAPSKGIELLQAAIPYEDGVRAAGPEIVTGAGTLQAVYVRGQAYLAAHQGRDAAQEFQKILDHRGVVLSDPLGALAHLQLGRAYSLAGEKDKARKAYEDYFRLWRDADSDIPILKSSRAEYAKLRY